jgi:hypothetical protein
MRRGPGSQLWIAVSLLFALATSAAEAVVIVPTFDPSILALSNATAVESSIDTAVNALDSLYANPGNVPVLFQYNAGLGGGAETDSATFTEPYSNYVAGLQADLAAHPDNSALTTAVAHLPSNATLISDFGSVPSMTFTAPFANLVLGTGQFLCFNSSGTFISGCNASTAGPYEAVVTISSTAVAPIEHELNEVLGGGGTGTTLVDTSTGEPTSLGPTDLYRYASTGTDCTTGLSQTLSWTASSSAVSCYSIDGGKTEFAQFNQSGGGTDYGDFAKPVPAIQDATESGTPPPYTMASPEFEMMESIGYYVPEPATIGLFVTALSGLGWFRWRGRGFRRLPSRV